MNILVLADHFVRGGLETHLDMYYNNLRKKHKFIYAFNTYQKTKYLEDAEIYADFNFKYDYKISKFISDVQRLIELIKEKKIDVIHTNSFYCIFPAMFAANATNTKLVLTHHGTTSISFVSSENDTILYQFAIENIASKIFCVANNAVDFYNSYNKKQAIFFPNLIDEKIFAKKKVGSNRKWALISRLDDDKFEEISRLLRILTNLEIDKLDIYGSGSKEESLKALVKELSLSNRVEFKGYVENMSSVITDYTGIAGLGRVALESLVMGLPCLLIGYGKIVGIIDEPIYNAIKSENFVTYHVQEAELEDIKEQIRQINLGNYDQYILRKQVIQDFGTKKVEEYEKQLLTANTYSLKALDKVYEEISALEDDSFFSSEEVFRILQKHLPSQTRNLYLKSQINILSKLYDTRSEVKMLRTVLETENQKRFDEFSALNNKVHQLEFDLKNISEKLNKSSKRKNVFKKH